MIRPATRRLRLPLRPAAAVGVLTLVLAGCSGSSDDAGPRASSSSGSTSGPSTEAASPTTAETAEPTEPTDVVRRLPGGTLSVAGTVRLRPRGDNFHQQTLLHDDTRIYLVTRTGVAIAVDRATGQQVWKTDLPFKDSAPTCTTPTLPPGATALSLYGGAYCSTRVLLDLATGKFTQPTSLVDEATSTGARTANLEFQEDPVQVGAWTYLVSQSGVISRIEPDGAVARVGSVAVPDGLYVTDAFASRDTDLLMITLDDLTEGTDKAHYVGVRISVGDDSTTAEVVWDVLRRDALGDVAPFTTQSKVDRGTGGLLISRVTPSGSRFQVAALDPATGLVAGRIELNAKSPGGYPAWAAGPGGATDSLVDGDQLYSSTLEPQALTDSITDYDLGPGKVAWTWSAPRSKDAVLATHAEPVAATEDGALLYALVTGTLDRSLLVELDATTGTETRRWELPAEAGGMADVRFDIVGDQVVATDALFGVGGASANRDLLALMNIS